MFTPQAPIVDLVESDYDKVVVRTPKRLTLAAEHNVRIRMRQTADAPLYPFRVFAIWDKIAPPALGSGWTCGCRLIKPTQLPQEGPSESGRKRDRVDGTFRAVSRDLPEFTAITLDISESGLQLKTRGPLTPGKILSLRIEAEMTEWDAVSFQAKVMWSTNEDRAFLAGLQYVNLDDEARERVSELAGFLAASRKEEVGKRTLQGADHLLKNKITPPEPS